VREEGEAAHPLREQQLPGDPARRPAPLGEQGGPGCGGLGGKSLIEQLVDQVW